MVILDFQSKPKYFETRVPPTSLPKVAINIMHPHNAQSSGVLSKPILVLSPVYTKNRGNKTTRRNIFDFIYKQFSEIEIRGIITPARNAPKRGCMPIILVRYADKNKVRKKIPITDLLIILFEVWRSAIL